MESLWVEGRAVGEIRWVPAESRTGSTLYGGALKLTFNMIGGPLVLRYRG